MGSTAAGLLMCRLEKELEFFLVHPGGPFFKNKDNGVWSIPKGMPEDNEEILATAKREFFEETGIEPKPPFHDIGSVKLKSGKVVYAWAFMGEWDESQGIVSNTCQVEWPPSSKKFIEIPEIDRAAWADFKSASQMIHPLQIPFLKKATDVFSKGKSF